MRSRKIIIPIIVAVVFMSALVVVPAGAAPTLSSASATRQIPIGGTTSPQTGAYTPSDDGNVVQVEFPGQEEEADGSPGPYPGTIVDRSLSEGTGKGVSA